MRYSRLKYSLIILVSVFIASCSNNPVPEKLQLSVKSSLNLLPEKPQFVMYMNFKFMRTTPFWKENVADSILMNENTFGSILNVFKSATGATISDGLDEIFFANSWTGENAIVMKGSFDRNKMNTFLSNDTLFRKTSGENNFNYYIHIPSNTSFFLKDNFTLCASNYTEQLVKMNGISDTSQTGLVTNNDIMTAINAIMYKESMWLVSTEKMFIRGIFANFIDMKSGSGIDKNSKDSLSLSPQNDSLSKTDEVILNKLHEKVNSISLNGKLKNDLDLVLQFECSDRESTVYVDKMFNGIIGLAKIASAGNKGNKNKEESGFVKIINNISLSNFDNTFLLSLKINSDNIKEIRKGTLIQ